MAKKIMNPMDIKEELLKDLREHFKDNLLSVVIHGSAATPRYAPGRSDINVLTVVSDNSVQALDGVHGLEKKWSRRMVEFSFFLTPEYIQNALDVFPLEFMEIKNTNLLLYGQDHFKDLRINRADLRLQCERELRGKVLHLRREYIRRQDDRKALAGLMNLSFSQFLIIFRGVLSAGNAGEIPVQAADLCRALGELLETDTAVLVSIAGRQIPKDLEGLRDLFRQYVPVMESVMKAVDKINTKT
jgi:predicted nucleotidyltransferase